MKNVSDVLAAVEQWLLTDSNVTLEKDDMALFEAAVIQDRDKTGDFPSNKEVEQLVCGDEEGMIPTELSKKFSNLNYMLNVVLI